MLTSEHTQELIEQRANREDSAGNATKYYGVSG